MAAKYWYEADPTSYAKVQQEVGEIFPELQFSKRGRDAFVTGYYPLFEGNRVYDRYLIEVELPKESPRGLPVVREIGGRIPRCSDRHMEPDGKACVVLPDAFWHEHPEGMSLLEFLNGPLRGFFASQSLLDLGISEPWPSGEWRHGADGIVDFYANLVGTPDPEIILEYLRVLKREVVKGHWPCPCGSAEKLRKCHRPLTEQLRSRIPRSIAAQSEERLFKAIHKTRTPPLQ